jgi:hypothetical protein
VPHVWRYTEAGASALAFLDTQAGIADISVAAGVPSWLHWLRLGPGTLALGLLSVIMEGQSVVASGAGVPLIMSSKMEYAG